MNLDLHPQPLIRWVPGALSTGVKQVVLEADHTPPSNAAVKNAWSYILPLLPTPLWFVA